jgi:hypothetical protein
VYRCNKRTVHNVVKAAAATDDDDDDEDGNGVSENNDKYLVISTIHEVFNVRFFPSSCYFILLRLKYRPQQNTLE